MELANVIAKPFLPLKLFFGTLLLISMQPAMAFWGPADKLRCRLDRVDSFAYGKSWSDGPRWDLHVEIFEDQVALTRSIDNEKGDVEILPAVVNRGYVKFDWEWAPDDPGLVLYEVTINRRENTLYMYRESPFASQHPHYTKNYFNCRAE